MKLCGISDLHGQINFDVKSCDVLCICGDILPLDIQMNSRASKKWLREKFLTWCLKQDAEIIILVGGNHDFYLFNHPAEVKEMFEGTKVKYLWDETLTYLDADGKSFKFYGTPWCHQFGSWAFMGYTDEGLKSVFDKMPEDVDVLVTHDAPYGCSDVCFEHYRHARRTEHIGSPALRDAILEKKPKLCLHGHLHTSNHEKENLGETDVYNVSLKNESYDLVFSPLYLTL